MGNWLYHYLGLSGTGPWYAWWSGFFADLTIFGAVIGGYKAISCHNGGCYRIARMTTKHGHKLCHKHAGKPNSELNLPLHHAEHV